MSSLNTAVANVSHQIPQPYTVQFKRFLAATPVS